MFKDTVSEDKRKHVHLNDLKKHVACCLTFGFNAFKMQLTLPRVDAALFPHRRQNNGK